MSVPNHSGFISLVICHQMVEYPAALDSFNIIWQNGCQNTVYSHRGPLSSTGMTVDLDQSPGISHSLSDDLKSWKRSVAKTYASGFTIVGWNTSGSVVFHLFCCFTTSLTSFPVVVSFEISILKDAGPVFVSVLFGPSSRLSGNISVDSRPSSGFWSI